MLRKFFSKAALSLLLLASAGTVTGYAQDLNSNIPVDSKITKGKLANGLTYYIRPNNKPEKKVELRLVINAGSILENDDQQGLAHFMEHMNFNGTKNYPKNKLVDFLQSIGVEFGADLNAYTSFDETVFILPIPTDKPGNLESGFQVIEDWAHNANLTEADINDERNVVLEESRLGKGADDRMMKIYLPKLLAGSQYGNRLPIGKDEILKTFKPETIRSFYRDWYRPDLMAVVVVGDITVDQAKALIEKHFGGIKNPANPRERKLFEVPAYKDATAMVLTDKEATNYQFQLFFSARKDQKEITVGDYRATIVKGIFTQILNKRFQELTQSANPPFAYSFAYTNSWARGYESFAMVAAPTADIQTAVNASVAELVKARDFGFTKSELEIVKKQLLSSMEKAYNERNTTESGKLVGEYVRNFLTAEPIPGIEAEYKYYQEMLPGITLEEVNTEAKKWLNKDDNQHYFALITGPAENKDMKLPTDAELKTMLGQAFTQTVTANAEKVIVENLLDKEPVAGKITAETSDKELGTTTYTLSNGVKVTVKKTDFKSDEIKLSAIKKGGMSNYGVADKSHAKFLPEVIESMGYGQFTPTALTDALSGKTIGLIPSMGEVTAEIRGNSSVKDLESLMQLTYLQLTEPRKDEALFSGFIGTMKMQLMFMGKNPQVAFIDTLIKSLYHNDPLRPIQIPTTDDISKINMDRVLEIYKNEFGNADGLHFFIVGNVDENAVKPLLEKYIASLPAKGGKAELKDNGLRPVNGVHKLEFKKGSEQQSLILKIVTGEMPYSEDGALKAQIIADILSITVIEQVRESMGAMYSGGFSGQMEEFPYNSYTIQGYFPCGPENVEPILKEVTKEIADIKANGPTQKDLDKARLAIIEKRKEGIKTNDYWTSKLEQLLVWNRSKDRFLNFEDNINKITVADIKAMANKMLNGKDDFTAILYPEKIEPKKEEKK